MHTVHVVIPIRILTSSASQPAGYRNVSACVMRADVSERARALTQLISLGHFCIAKFIRVRRLQTQSVERMSGTALISHLPFTAFWSGRAVAFVRIICASC